MIGIYSIKSKINNKIYVGSSINIEARLKNHKYNLKLNQHKNCYLQSTYNKYGIENLEFNILEECTKENILEKENFYIKKYNTNNSNFGYNQVIATRKDNLYCSQEYLNKLSLVKKGKSPTNLVEMRNLAKRSILEFENNNLIREYESCKEAGRILKVEYKLINNVLRGKVKHIRKFPNKTWKYKEGSVRLTKKNSSCSWKKGKTKPILQYTLERKLLNRFNSTEEATKILNISRGMINNNCNNLTKTCRKLNCIFKYE